MELHEAARFHDGRHVVAGDVVRSLRRLLEGDSVAADLLSGQLEGETAGEGPEPAIQASSQRTVVLRLGTPSETPPREGKASKTARTSYVCERLRLLYVGITRARRSLVVTWNTGRRQQDRLQPALPFTYLLEYAQIQVAAAQSRQAPEE